MFEPARDGICSPAPFAQYTPPARIAALARRGTARLTWGGSSRNGGEMAIVPSEPGPSQLFHPSPVGSEAESRCVRTPGTCGVSDGVTPELRISRVEPAGPVVTGSSGNLFSILRRSKDFSAIYDEMSALGMKVKVGKALSSRRSTRPGGSYDFYTNTFELPADALSGRGPISDAGTLETIGHEVRHAHQHRSLLKRSNLRGGTEAVCRELMDEAMGRMGRAKFLSSFLVMEKQAEHFGIRVTLEALGKAHTGFIVFREMFPGSSPRDFVDWKVETWWMANSNLYVSQSKYLWDEYAERTRK